MKHTPLPLDAFGTAVFTDSQGYLCAISSGEGSSAESEEAYANARLISAAPDLLNACRAAFEALESLQGGCTDSDDGTVEAITVWCPEVIDELRAAIEKAVGY